jgi:hypothetical protein
MQSAGYFRDQATLCLEIARHISNLQAVENLRASAARHLVKADDVEKRRAGHRSISPAAERSNVSDVAAEKQGSHGEQMRAKERIDEQELLRRGRRPLLSASRHGTGENVRVAAGWNNISRDRAARCEVQGSLPLLSLACFVLLAHHDGKSI